MIGTFVMVLVFTSLKEGYEDLARHKSDRELNNKKTLVWNAAKGTFDEIKWKDIKVG